MCREELVMHLSFPLLAFFLCLVASVCRAEVPVDTWRAQMRQNFFIDPLPDRNPEVHRRFTPTLGVRAEAVTYGTQFGLRVPAIVYLPDPLPKTTSGKVPAFIVVNGHGGDKFSWYAFYTGILYARAGAVVLTYDPTGEGERNSQRLSGTRAHDKIKGDAVLARKQAGLMITDVMQAVSYLSQRPEVDAQRIGVAGYSMGSFVIALAGAIDPRIRACVPVGGGNLDGPGEYWDKSKPMCQALPYQSLHFLGDRAAAIYAMHATRGPTLIFNGRDDTVVNMPSTQEPFFDDLRSRVTGLRGIGEGVFDYQFVDGASHRPFFITRPVALWLEKHLDFPNWNEDQIKALPETRISHWAAKHSIPMDKLYATEPREGGTPALLDDVPGYKREDLAVFSEDEWRQRKETMILESWLAKVRATSN
jgi:dienelactone hydrolase